MAVDLLRRNFSRRSFLAGLGVVLAPLARKPRPPVQQTGYGLTPYGANYGG